MSRRVIGMAFTNQARGDKSNNNAIGGIGARGTAVRNAIINRSTNCCNRSSGSSSSGNENFITLEQALAQSGVFSGQILFLCNNRGLVLSNNFIVHNGGFVIFCDIVNPQGNVPSNSNGTDDNKFAGIFVAESKTLTVHGEIVLGNISSNAANNKDVYGIYNKGTIEISGTGSITMGDISSVNQNAHGIFQESTIQKHTVSNSAGAIQMGNITSENANAFGVKNGDLNDVRVQIGNVSGGNEASAVNLFDSTTPGNMSAHVIAGDVTNSGTSLTTSVYVNELSGSFSCGDVSSTSNGNVNGIITTTLSGSATCGNVEGNIAFGIYIRTLSGSATCGDVEGNVLSYGIFVTTLSGSATCGDVEGNGTIEGFRIIDKVNESGVITCGNITGNSGSGIDSRETRGGFVRNLNGKVSCGNVKNKNSASTGDVYGISVTTLSGSATCGDVSSTGESTTDNVITVTGLFFTTVYPEAQVTIGNISATSGICRGAFSTSDTAILAGTTNIGSVSSNVDFDNDSNFLRSGGIVKNTGSQNLSDSFVTYNGDGKGLKFEVSIDDNGQYEVINRGFTNATNYVNNQEIIINGEFFGGDQTNDVTLTISVDENGDTRLNITNNPPPPTDPRVRSTGVITTNGLSGSFTVKDCSLTNTSNVNANLIVNVGFSATKLNGSFTCGNVEGGNVSGISVNTLSGSATCGNIESGGNVRGISVNTLSGSFTCGNVEGGGSGDVSGISVNTLSGSATCGDVEGTGSGVVRGINVNNTLSGSATCGDVEGTGSGDVRGIVVGMLSGSATCGDVEGTGSGDVRGISVNNTLSGSATCGDVEGNGITYGFYINNQVNESGVVIVGNITNSSSARTEGGFVRNLNGKVTCGNVKNKNTNNTGDVKGIVVGVSGETGKADCGNVSTEGNGIVYGMQFNNGVSGKVTCGDVEGNGITYGVYSEANAVINESGVVIVGNITGNSSSVRTEGGFLRNLNGKVTCGNVKNKNTTSTGDVKGLFIENSSETGKADCGNVSTEGNGIVYGIQVGGTLSGNATCGNVSSEGSGTIFGLNVPGKINGNVIIESAPTGLGPSTEISEPPGTGNVIIGAPQGGGVPGSVNSNKLSAYIYGNTIVIPTP